MSRISYYHTRFRASIGVRVIWELVTSTFIGYQDTAEKDSGCQNLVPENEMIASESAYLPLRRTDRGFC